MSMLAVHSFAADNTATAPEARSEALSTPELCEALERLAQLERHTEWLSCRHLAELADRFERRDLALGAYADVYQLARLRFSMGVRRARERVRIGRALRALPQIERAFVAGQLGYAPVRELTRVATAADEAMWLELARELPLRVLERRVAEASGGGEQDKTGEPAAVRWASPESVEVRLSMPAAAWALLERAMEGARQLCCCSPGESSLSDAEALAAVARDALARQTDGEDRADVRHMVVLYACRSCGRNEVETGAGAIELGEAAAATLACSAKCCDLDSEGRTVSHGGAVPAAVRRAVMLRDRMRCRALGCTGRRYVDLHHITAREHGGEHSRRNCLLLCGRCHARVHDGRLRIEGDADGELRFYDASGNPLGAADVTPGGHLAERGCSAAATTLLGVIGKRGGWHADQLCEESRLSISEVMCGLLELELCGRIRPGVYGHEPVAAC